MSTRDALLAVPIFFGGLLLAAIVMALYPVVLIMWGLSNLWCYLFCTEEA